MKVKSTIQQIPERFDDDVERFSKLETDNTALLQQVGFHDVEVLHKNIGFAAFGARK